MPPDDVTLRVRGLAYGGWRNVSISRSIENVCGAFSVSVSERWPGQPTARPIRPGDPVSVAIDEDLVITGHVDQVQNSLGAEVHTVRVSGRDAAADLVDSAPDLPPNEWHGITVLELAQILAKPFGVPVRSEVGDGRALPKVALNPGESAWSLLEERCRYEGFLLVSDGRGGIVLTRAASARATTAIVEGDNMLSGTLALDWSERFSQYIVKGQLQGTDFFSGEAASEPAGSTTDAEIQRHRPLVVIAATGADARHCADRARWEAAVRAGRGARASVTVEGWRSGGGQLWPINALVALRSPTLGINREMLISEVSFSKGDGGTLTTLSLVRPEAFALLQQPELPAGGEGFDDFGFEGFDVAEPA